VLFDLGLSIRLVGSRLALRRPADTHQPDEHFLVPCATDDLHRAEPGIVLQGHQQPLLSIRVCGSGFLGHPFSAPFLPFAEFSFSVSPRVFVLPYES